MRRLKHLFIACVFDLQCDQGVWFMVMELLRGQSLSRYLTERSQFFATPMLGGWLDYSVEKTRATVGILHQFIPNQGDAWRLTLDSIRRSFEWALANPAALAAIRPPDRFVLHLCGTRPPAADELLAGYIPLAHLLGERTADLHLALAADTDDASFRPDDFSVLHQRSLYQAVRTGLGREIEDLKRRMDKLPERTRIAAQMLVERRGELDERMRRILDHKLETARVRVHGDFHLGQVLYTGSDFVIIDFEGEPNRSIGDRRFKRSPLKDVAGMLRSFDYAAAVSLRSSAGARPDDFLTLEPWAFAWRRWSAAAFLNAYLARAAGAPFIPSSAADLEVLLDFYLIEKCVYELGYELASRPDWAEIPLHGLVDLLLTDPRKAT